MKIHLKNLTITPYASGVIAVCGKFLSDEQRCTEDWRKVDCLQCQRTNEYHETVASFED